MNHDKAQFFHDLELHNDVAAALEKRYGPFLDADPSTWPLRTVQLVGGLLYGRLLANDLPTSREQVGLIKAMVPQLLKAAKLNGQQQENEPKPHDREEFNEELKTVVRQIYGVNLQFEPPDQSGATAPASVVSSSGGI